MVKMQHQIKNILKTVSLSLLLFQAIAVCGWERVAGVLTKLAAEEV